VTLPFLLPRHSLSSPLSLCRARETEKASPCGVPLGRAQVGALRPSLPALTSPPPFPRCIYGYFSGARMEDIPTLPFKTHHLYQLSPGPFGCDFKEMDLSEGGH
jgi:hypothetical protein